MAVGFLGFCAPPDTKLLDYVRVYVNYARRKRESSQDNAAVLAIRSLNESFPCDAGRSAGGVGPDHQTRAVR